MAYLLYIYRYNPIIIYVLKSKSIILKTELICLKLIQVHKVKKNENIFLNTKNWFQQ